MTDGIAGWRIVRMIEAADCSLKTRGETVLLKPTGSLQNERAHAASAEQPRIAS
jgi:hypothetical protein